MHLPTAAATEGPAPPLSLAAQDPPPLLCHVALPTLTVHCHQQCFSPSGPGLEASTQVWLVCEGSDTYTRRGSMDTTTACGGSEGRSGDDAVTVHVSYKRIIDEMHAKRPVLML